MCLQDSMLLSFDWLGSYRYIYFAVFVNGCICKDPKLAKADDFFFSALAKKGYTMNKVGSKVTQVNVAQIPGVNTLGISLVRIDFAPYAQNPPHTHPHATQILTVINGTLFVGFVTSNQDNNHLITKVLQKGDVFVFPVCLIYFQVGIGQGNSSTLFHIQTGPDIISNPVVQSFYKIPS